MAIYQFHYGNKLITIDGYENDIISVQAHGQQQRFFEIELLEYIYFNYPNNKTIIDIGAHIGNHSLYFANFLRYEKIYCFEPFIGSYQKLINNVGNVASCYHCALSDKEGYGKLEKTGSDMGCFQVNESDSEEHITQIKTLDFFNISNVTLMKIDAESFEPKVFKGGLNTIQRCKPVIFTEANTLDELEQQMNVLEPLGYRVGRSFNDCGTSYEIIPI